MSQANTPSSAEVLNALDKMNKTLEGLRSAEDSSRKSLPLPHVRRGEDPLTSRGYSFLRLFQAMSGQINKDQAKVEVDLSNKLQKHWYDTHGYKKTESNSILAPLGSNLFPQGVAPADEAFVKEVREVTRAGTFGADRDEVAAIRSRTLSWQDGGLTDLVSPPTYGELIDILRNNEALMQCGCTTIGLPPNGRLVMPRQTGASSAYYIGESQALTVSEPTTGDVTLQAKKVACLVKVPNELFRYASVSVEAFLRADIAAVLGLRIDKELLEGTGSAVSPKGLINYAGITSHTSAGTPADSNSGYPLQPEDVATMIAKVEEKNAQFKAFLMRPLMWAYLTNRRADAVTGGDGKGQFMFNIWRGLADGMDLARNASGVLNGYPVYKSTQLSNTRTRGTGTTSNTYILGGDFSDYILGLSPTIEFAMTNTGDTPFQNDQTWIRAILPHDGMPRREASFILCDNLLF